MDNQVLVGPFVAAGEPQTIRVEFDPITGNLIAERCGVASCPASSTHKAGTVGPEQKPEGEAGPLALPSTDNRPARLFPISFYWLACLCINNETARKHRSLSVSLSASREDQSAQQRQNYYRNHHSLHLLRLLSGVQIRYYYIPNLEPNQIFLRSIIKYSYYYFIIF